MSNTYEAIVTIAKDYLGPAAERFVIRQISFHLNKKPEELTPGDIPKISQWIKVSLAMLTDDKKMVDDASVRIAKLATS